MASHNRISTALADPTVPLDWQRSGLSRSHCTATSLVDPRSQHGWSGLRHATAHSRATGPALQHRPLDRRPGWWCCGLRHVPRWRPCLGDSPRCAARLPGGMQRGSRPWSSALV